MKIIELNIGLASKTLGTLNPNEVLNSLTGRGFTLLKYRLVDSVSKDGKETCLAVKAECPNDWQEQLASLSDRLGQDCIALVGFIGHSPYDTFCAPLWVSTEESPGEPTGDGHTLGSFAHYLRETLIPDLESDGYSATAEDFKEILRLTGN